MKALIVGTSVISVIYGWALTEAGVGVTQNSRQENRGHRSHPVSARYHASPRYRLPRLRPFGCSHISTQEETERQRPGGCGFIFQPPDFQRPYPRGTCDCQCQTMPDCEGCIA